MTTGLVRLSGQLDDQCREWAGGKAVGLAALQRAGLAVPDTWVVPTGMPPASVQLDLIMGVAQRWAVRSSATVEDGTHRSYAGIFHSELDVAPKDLPGAIGRVQASAHGNRAAAYRKRFGGDAEVGMAVLLQPYREPARSGVWLGRGLTAGRLEWTSGSGNALVSGAVTPAWEEWTSAGQVHSSGDKQLECGRRVVGATCVEVQHTLGVPADLEFAIVDSKLVWLQFRSTTADLSDIAASGALANDCVVQGIAAAPGQADGNGLRLFDAADPRWEAGAVLLTEQTDPDWVALMAEAAALVTATGGMLCHAAIIARELGIPCVTGVGRTPLARLADRALMVNGSTGTVSVR